MDRFLTHAKALNWGASFKAKMFSSILLVVLADYLLYEAGFGIGMNAGVFCIILLGFFSLHNFSFLKFRAAYAALALIIIQCVWFIERASFLSLALVICGLLYLIVLRIDGQGHDSARILRRGLNVLFKVFSPANKMLATMMRIYTRRKHSVVLGSIIRHWLLPFGASVLFVCLFSYTNPIIFQWFESIDMVSVLQLFSVWRWLFWLVCFSAVFAIIRPKLKRYRVRLRHEKDSGRGLVNWLFTKEAVLRSLILFNVLFALQTSMDVRYLFGGMALPEGINYAEYAQKGAYPLIATALLAAVFVLVTQGAGEHVSKARYIQPLIYLWIAQNIILVMSSIYRTSLYVDTYSLTYLRFAAFVWMGLVASGLCWIVLRGALDKSSAWLVNANVLTLFTVLYGLSFFNIGAFIADYNVMHSREVTGHGVRFDRDYMRSIGSSAIPALEKFERLTGEDVVVLDTLILELDSEMDNWKLWTFSKSRLLEDLKKAGAPPS